MRLEHYARKQTKATLVELITTLHGIDNRVDALIEQTLGLNPGTDTHRLAHQISHTLNDIRDDDEFVGYYDSDNLAYQLQSVLLDINTLLREQAPQQALELTETFLWLVEPVMQRADDSNGMIGDVFRDAVDQWLDIAAERRAMEPDAEDWLEKIRHFFHHNDYGCYDNIIRHSHDLLTEPELRQLAWRFENATKQALKSPEEPGYNFPAARASIGLKSVAQALCDMALYEKSVLLTSPTPNTLQLENLVRTAFTMNALDRAEYWLAQPQWQDDPWRQRHLRYDLLEHRNDLKALKDALHQDLLSTPDSDTLERYWDQATQAEKQQLRQHLEHLPPLADLHEHITMLLMAGATARAADVIITRPDSLAGLRFYTLLDWLETLESAHHPLAAALCYRNLLNDILDRGNTRAYHHAARYFHRLLDLDTQITDYQGQPDAQAFVRQIQQQHWRKRSFWADANYPNKPE